LKHFRNLFLLLLRLIYYIIKLETFLRNCCPVRKGQPNDSRDYLAIATCTYLVSSSGHSFPSSYNIIIWSRSAEQSWYWTASAREWLELISLLLSLSAKRDRGWNGDTLQKPSSPPPLRASTNPYKSSIGRGSRRCSNHIKIPTIPSDQHCTTHPSIPTISW
jgi:hypothetical protein